MARKRNPGCSSRTAALIAQSPHCVMFFPLLVVFMTAAFQFVLLSIK
jgi:hypothetical protein